MAGDRLSRDDFYDALATLDEAGLKEALWGEYEDRLDALAHHPALVGRR